MAKPKRYRAGPKTVADGKPIKWPADPSPAAAAPAPSFTPGPWIVEDRPEVEAVDRGKPIIHHKLFVRVRDSWWIAELVPGIAGPNGTVEANASLIAAAPELLDSLFKLIARTSPTEGDCWCSLSYFIASKGNPHSEGCLAARAAIAKAVRA